MLGGVPDIDLDVVDGSGNQALLKSNVKVKGRRGPGNQRNVDPDLDVFINANLLPEGDPMQGCCRLVLDIYFGNVDMSKCEFWHVPFAPHQTLPRKTPCLL